jgi:hypothetical protein
VRDRTLVLLMADVRAKVGSGQANSGPKQPRVRFAFVAFVRCNEWVPKSLESSPMLTARIHPAPNVVSGKAVHSIGR